MSKQEPATKRIAYTCAEVARMTGRDRSTIGRWLKAGVLKSMNLPGRHPLVTAASLEKLLRVDAVGGRDKKAQQ